MKRLPLPCLLLLSLAIVMCSMRPSNITVLINGQVQTAQGAILGARTCAHLLSQGSDCSNPDDCSNPQYTSTDGHFRIQFEAVEHAAAFIEVKKEGYTTVRKSIDKRRLNQHQTVQLSAPIFIAKLYTANKMDRMDDTFLPEIEVYGNPELTDKVIIKVANIHYFRDVIPVRDTVWHETGPSACQIEQGKIYRTRIKKHKQPLPPDSYYLLEPTSSTVCQATH